MLLSSTMSTTLQLYVSMRLYVNMKLVNYAMVLAWQTDSFVQLLALCRCAAWPMTEGSLQ
jgi:hypothetical protein